MSLLITAVLFGLWFAYIATQNTAGLTLHFGGYSFRNIPVYGVLLGSFLVGLFVSWFLSAIGWVSSALTIRGKDSRINQAEKTITSLKRQIHDLEIENTVLKEESRRKPEVRISERKPDILDHLRRPATS